MRRDEAPAEAGLPLAPKRPPVRRRKLYEEVALRIEEMIREGRYTEGDSLPAERELMAELGVGRSAVREALMALARMGLVSVNSGERARVTAPTAESLVSELSGAARLLLAQPGGVRSFQEARALLEIGLCRLAAQRATDADLAALAAALEANRAAIGNHAALVRTDVAFHYAIAAISRSSIFIAVHDAVVEWLMEQRGTTLRAPGTAEEAYQAHRRIYEAIAAHDMVAAEAEMEAHLNTVVEVYWDVRRHEERPGTASGADPAVPPGR
jgi:GntR family transcriptional repressor for pyruvate dehydrogenase complex